MIKLFYLFCLGLLHYTEGTAQLKLPRLIGDGMVLQRNLPVNIWGWTNPNDSVSIRCKNKTYKGKADIKGNWKIILPAMPAAGPFEMTIASGNVISIKDILVGDVWLCSGQSNMELMMTRVKYKYPEEITNANNPLIRQFTVPDKYDFQKERDDLEAGEWLAVNNKNIGEFSAVAYFFAKELYAKYKVPIGLINAALGGSPAEAWINETGLKQFPAYFDSLQKYKSARLIAETEAMDRNNTNDWFAQLNAGDAGLKMGWKLSSFNDNDWNQMMLPGYWADMNNVNGVVWFRKNFFVPATHAGKEALLWMGRIVDADSVFINDHFIGTTSYQYPPRIYTIPAEILKPGDNTIVVRVVNNSGKGGFVPEKKYRIDVDNTSIPLEGEWKYKTGAVMPPAPSSTTIRWKPGGLFNAMIAPLTNYAIKGVIWYQGESNAGHPNDYTELMKTLIQQWRKQFRQGNFPFIYVQLPNFGEPAKSTRESNWALLREQQSKLQSTPNTAMVITIDIGEWNDIHPLNKKDVGKRLSLAAIHLAYAEKKVAYSGPVFQKMKPSGNKMVLSFTNTGAGLVSKDGKPLTQFQVAGTDNHFVLANATIKGNTIIVWSDCIKKPIAVRYAWADDPEPINFYNREGLPAAPFRTDHYSTDNK